MMGLNTGQEVGMVMVHWYCVSALITSSYMESLNDGVLAFDILNIGTGR